MRFKETSLVSARSVSRGNRAEPNGRFTRNPSMQRRILILLAAALLALALAACGSSGNSNSSSNSNSGSGSSSSGGSAQITIDSTFTYHTSPVKAGATVTVKNDSSATHTVTQDGGGFN